MRHFGVRMCNVRRTRVFTVIPPTVPKLKTAKNLRLRLRSHRGLNTARVRHTMRALVRRCHGCPTLTSIDDRCRTGMPRCFLGVSHSGMRLVNVPLGDMFATLNCCVKRTCIGSCMRFKRVCRIGLKTNSHTRHIVSSILGLDIPGTSKRVMPFSSFAQIRRRLNVSRVGECGVCSATTIAYGITPNDDSKRNVQRVRDLVGRRLKSRFNCR